MYEAAQLVVKILVDLIAAILSAGDDAKAREDALIDAEFKIAQLRADRRFKAGA